MLVLLSANLEYDFFSLYACAAENVKCVELELEIKIKDELIHTLKKLVNAQEILLQLNQ